MKKLIQFVYVAAHHIIIYVHNCPTEYVQTGIYRFGLCWAFHNLFLKYISSTELKSPGFRKDWWVNMKYLIKDSQHAVKCVHYRAPVVWCPVCVCVCVYLDTGAIWEESGAFGGLQSAFWSAGDQKLPHCPSGNPASLCCSLVVVLFWWQVLDFTVCFQNLVKVMTLCPQHDLVSFHVSRSFCTLVVLHVL